jgi:hypothetical protein
MTGGNQSIDILRRYGKYNSQHHGKDPEARSPAGNHGTILLKGAQMR